VSLYFLSDPHSSWLSFLHYTSSNRIVNNKHARICMDNIGILQYSNICVEGTRKATKNLHQYGQCLGWQSNTGHLNMKQSVLTNQLRFSVSTNIMGDHNIQVTTASKMDERHCHVYLNCMTSQAWQIILYSISNFGIK